MRLTFLEAFAVKQKVYLIKQKHTLSTLTGFLVVLAALIAGLASANMTTGHKNRFMMHAQKLDTSDDGSISLDELAMCQDRRFTKLDHDENRMIEKHEFNAHLITMFDRMDCDGNGVLQGDELPGHHYSYK